jgi:hypothetical protein
LDVELDASWDTETVSTHEMRRIKPLQTDYH